MYDKDIMKPSRLYIPCMHILTHLGSEYSYIDALITAILLYIYTKVAKKRHIKQQLLYFFQLYLSFMKYYNYMLIC